MLGLRLLMIPVVVWTLSLCACGGSSPAPVEEPAGQGLNGMAPALPMEPLEPRVADAVGGAFKLGNEYAGGHAQLHESSFAKGLLLQFRDINRQEVDRELSFIDNPQRAAHCHGKGGRACRFGARADQGHRVEDLHGHIESRLKILDNSRRA